MNFFFLLALILTSGFAQTTDLRNQRYCEVLLGAGTIFKGVTFDVYNTIGLNFCPQEEWVKLNEKQIKKKWNTDFAKLNGPRFWTMDSMKSSLLDPTIVKFNELEMRKAGVVELGFKDIFGKRKSYQERKVRRNSVWIFDAKKLVYELISPSGKTYIMQSFSTEVRNLRIQDLENLKPELILPKGWNYRARLLTEDLRVPIPFGLATVIQDNFYNSYTLIE